MHSDRWFPYPCLHSYLKFTQNFMFMPLTFLHHMFSLRLKSNLRRTKEIYDRNNSLLLQTCLRSKPIRKSIAIQHLRYLYDWNMGRSFTVTVVCSVLWYSVCIGSGGVKITIYSFQLLLNFDSHFCAISTWSVYLGIGFF